MNNAKLFCLIAFALTVSGCGGGDTSGSQVLVDDPLNTGDTVVTDGIAGVGGDSTVITETDLSDMETINGTATPVQTVSSAQMDAFVANPLLAAIPTELSGGAPVATSNFITNPLM